MSQVLAEQYNTNNDVVNNNRSEWHKNLAKNGLIADLAYEDAGCVYSPSDINERRLAGKDNLKQSSKPGDSRFSNIQDGLESSISGEGKDRVIRILNDVNRLSDVEKLLLYLKLPTGITPDEGLRETPTSFLHSSNRIEQAQAFTWIRSHLEEDIEICVPKHEVYDDYRLYCESHTLKPLCPADFGKVMKCVFPGVKPRRLGQRGQSKYCYSGLRKKLEVQPPSLPELEITPKKEKEENTEEDEVYTASKQLVCEWAHKLLGGAFSNLRELAEFLVGNLYVNSKSTAAFTVLAAMQDAGLHNSKVPVSSLFTCSSGGNKHKETQLQLQRKLQERELIKEQKRKLVQQRSENERENETLHSQTSSVSPSPVRSAARNITKLLQSPGAVDPPSGAKDSASTKASPVVVHQILRCRDGQSSVTLSLESPYNGHNHMDVPPDLDAQTVRAGHSGRESESGQYHVVKKPSVRTVANAASEPVEKVDAVATHVEQIVGSVGSKTPEKNSENGHFALPTTPNRSAFVPVSNQWKESDSPSIQLSPNHNHITSVKSESQSQEADNAYMDATTSSDSNDGLKMYLTDYEQCELRSDGKDICSPITVGNDGIAVNIPSSPQTPRKSKSRFTPIRPKVTPTKTVSSMLKDQKTVNGEAPTYDSRPVSAILKERRAREAQEILAQIASNVQIQGSMTAVSSDILKLHSQSNEVFIIVGSPKPGSGAGSSQGPCGFDMLNSSQFPPNVTAPMHQSPVSLPMLLAKHNEAKLQASKRAEASSLDSSDLSDNDVPTKPDESHEKMFSRDADTPLGRKRKSSEKEVESKTKRMNSTDARTEESESLARIAEARPTVRVGHSSRGEVVIKQTASPSDKVKAARVPGSKLSVESLESDALLDSTPMAVDHDLMSSLSKPSPPSTQTASVGVSAKSMRSAQKQLLQEKLQLDQRLSNFFSKGQKVQKEGETASQQLTVADKKRVEQILLQYAQQHLKKDPKTKVCVPTTRPAPVPNNQPVNLLSLLQRPVFDSKVVLSSINKSKDGEVSPRAPPEQNVSMPSPKMASESDVPMACPKMRSETNMSTVSSRLVSETKVSVANSKVESRKMSLENNISMTSQNVFPENKVPLAIRKVPPEKNVPIAIPKVESEGNFLVASRVMAQECRTTLPCPKMLPNSLLGLLSEDLCGTGSDLPSDVADFITENMAARENVAICPQLSLDISKKLRDIIHMPSLGDIHYDSISDHKQVVVSDPAETFTVPPTPPPPRQKSDSATAKVRYAPVQRSISLPVFVPTSIATSHCPNLLTLGKGLDMPAPPNRVIDSSSPQPLHQKSTTPVQFPAPGRQPIVRPRQTSTERLANHTPMSDAGYHSFDTSPVMNPATPVVMMGTVGGGGDNSIHNTSSISASSVRPDSAQSFPNEPLPTQSPVPLASPRAPSARSTPNSVVSPHMTSHSSIAASPIESMTSPNSFMPIQGGMSPNCPSLGSPQMVTPIKPLVAVAASPSYSVTSTTFTSALLMQLTSESTTLNSSSRIRHHASSDFQDTKQQLKHVLRSAGTKEPGPKIGVLEKLLNSKSLPSYEEALNHLCKTKTEEKGTEGSDRVSKPSEGDILQSNVAVAKSQSRSSSSADPERKLKQGNNPALLEALERGTGASDAPQLKTSDYPFSYQLALLKEKCLNPNPNPLGKENKSKTINKLVGQSVQRKSTSSKPSETKSTSSENSADMLESEQFNQCKPGLQHLDNSNQVHSSIIVTQANATHHHYGNASQKASSANLSHNATSSGSQRSKSSSSTAAQPPASPAQSHSFPATSAVPSIPPVPSASSTSKHRQLASSASSYQPFDLPNVNYMGNAPNIDLGSLLQVKQDGGADGTGGGERLVQGLPPANTINEEELQSTLEILRGLDSQYFSSAELDVDSMQPSPQTQHSPAVLSDPPGGPPHPPANSPAGPESRSSKRSWSYPNNVSSR